jgi:hypothetical protein
MKVMSEDTHHGTRNILLPAAVLWHLLLQFTRRGEEINKHYYYFLSQTSFNRDSSPSFKLFLPEVGCQKLETIAAENK